jgi:hypothetical protein
VGEYKTSNRRGVSKTTARKKGARERMKKARKMRLLESFKKLFLMKVQRKNSKIRL